MNQSDILEKSPSLEEMLTQIKKIMSEDMNLEQKKEDIKAIPQEDDVLELSPTSIIEEDVEQKESEDILQNIDNILDQKKSDEPVMEKVSEPQKQEEVKTHEPKQEAALESLEPKADTPPEAQKPEDILEEIAKKQESAIIPEKHDRRITKLVSDESAQESSDALRTLLKKVEKPTTNGPGFRSGTTLEDLVVEMIKPKLSDWLDENLPNIVKNIVEKEVRKLIPRDDE